MTTPPLRTVLTALLLLAGCDRVSRVCADDGEGAEPTMGDANGDGFVDVSDGVFVHRAALHGGPEPACLEAADVIGEGQVEPGDTYALWAHLFSGSGLNPLPSGACTDWDPAPPVDCARLDLRVEAPHRVGPGEAFEAVVLLVNRDLDPGPEAWSISVRVDGCQVVEATTAGTVAAHTSEGGLRGTGFDQTSLADGGAVSAVVLDWFEWTRLEPVRKGYEVLRLTMEAPRAADCTACTLHLDDGRVGLGQPVENVISVDGRRYRPQPGSVEVEVCP